MPVKHARHIALTALLSAWVDELVTRGDYASASDLVRTALRQMQERDADKAQLSTQQVTAAAQV